MTICTFAEFRTNSVMPNADIDGVETQSPGFVQAQLNEKESRIYSVLRKRYAVPFTAPVPDVVKGWQTRLVTPQVYFRRGINPSDAQYDEIKADAAAAWEEVKQAADSQTGLFDLPLRQDQTSSGVTTGGPLGYSEASPYTFTDRQVEAVRSGGER